MLSKEQLDIYNNLKLNNSILVESCAGSGKTTLIEYIVNNMKDKNILILCYNRMLMNNTYSKIYMLDNITCNTFHSFGLKYYNSNCITDEGILTILENNHKKVKNDIFDLIIIDECQDITYYYNEFISKIIKDYCKDNYLICMLGDSNQMIYKFKGASTDYMYMRNLIKFKLNISFRITNNMAHFIRNGLNIEIYSDKIGSPVRFIETDNRWYATYKEVCYYLNLGYNYSDIYIITPSTKCKYYNSSIKLLQQLLTYKNIFIEIPDDNYEKSINFFNNKLLISTIHGMKGLENKIVIFTMFDKTYDNIFKKTNLICPNEIYVALTRATDHLSIISNGNHFDFFNKSILDNIIYYSFYSHNSLCFIYPLKFINNDIIRCEHGGSINLSLLNENTEKNIYRICFKCINKNILYFIDYYNWNNYPNKNYIKIKYEKSKYSVTELLSFINIDDIIYINELNKNNQIYELKKTIYFNKIDYIKKHTNQYFDNIEICESIQSLIGRIIIYYIEYKLTNDINIINNDTVRKNVSLKIFNKICDKDIILNEIEKNINKNKCCEMLTIISLYDEMIHTNYTHRVNLQIKNYNIINIKIIEKIFKKFKKYLVINNIINDKLNITKFEVPVEKNINDKKIRGSIDMIFNNNIVEFKCKSFSTKEDIYQLLIYAYLFNKDNNYKYNNYKYKIINLYTNEYTDIIINDHDKILDIIDYFIKKCNK
jgi:hypothetical protein